MGYTAHTKNLVEKILTWGPIESVVDLGAQNDFSGPALPAPYISDWFKEKGIEYSCIDLNGENGASTNDLSKIFKAPGGWQGDMVCDIGTSEHVGDNGKFGWEAIYNCWVNKWNLLKINGILLNENPLSGNWIGHGFNYYTAEFYHELIQMIGGGLLELDFHPACGNTTDGWNVWSIMRKRQDAFISLDQFKTLSLKQS